MIDLVKEKVFQEKYVRLEKAEQESIKKEKVSLQNLIKRIDKKKKQQYIEEHKYGYCQNCGILRNMSGFCDICGSVSIFVNRETKVARLMKELEKPYADRKYIR